MTELAELDVEWSMSKTCEVISKALDDVEKNGPKGASELLDLVEKKVKEAEDFYWRPLDQPQIYTRLGAIFESAGKKAEAQKYLAKIKEQEAAKWEFRGRLQNFFGDNTRAAKYYAKALELQPDFPEAKKGLETAKKRADKADAEIKKIEATISKKPGVMASVVKLGICLADKGDLKGATEKFDQVLQKEPDNIDALCKKAHMLESVGDYAKAKPFLEKAQGIKPSSLAAKRGLNYANYFIEHPDEVFKE